MRCWMPYSTNSVATGQPVTFQAGSRLPSTSEFPARHPDFWHLDSDGDEGEVEARFAYEAATVAQAHAVEMSGLPDEGPRVRCTLSFRDGSGRAYIAGEVFAASIEAARDRPDAFEPVVEDV
jgi:hypothetical protein